MAGEFDKPYVPVFKMREWFNPFLNSPKAELQHDENLLNYEHIQTARIFGGGEIDFKLMWDKRELPQNGVVILPDREVFVTGSEKDEWEKKLEMRLRTLEGVLENERRVDTYPTYYIEAEMPSGHIFFNLLKQGVILDRPGFEKDTWEDGDNNDGNLTLLIPNAEYMVHGFNIRITPASEW